MNTNVVHNSDNRTPRITMPTRLALFVIIGLVVFERPGAPCAAAEPVDPAFEVTIYAEGLVEPTAIAFAPDGRLFVAEKGGRVRIVQNGIVQNPPFVEIEVLNFLESGLIGLTLDPDFTNNRYVYLFATVSFEEQRIYRFTDDNGVATDETIIRQHLPSVGTVHNSGCIKFGPDGMLYFSIGDNANPANAQELDTFAGKICRINPDGATPADNPFTTPTGSPRAIYALGLRNPFRFCFAPDGRIFALDVGSGGEARREEINIVRAGDNCGWPIVEGLFDSAAFPQFVNPTFVYKDKGSAPTGVVYYTGTQFPAEYVGNLFHLDYTLNRVFRVVLDGDRTVSHDLFVQAEGAPTDLAQGPDGCLYYCELVDGRIRRICHSANAPPPGGGPTNVEPPASSLCAFGSAPALLSTLALLILGLPGRLRQRPR